MGVFICYTDFSMPYNFTIITVIIAGKYREDFSRAECILAERFLILRT